MESHDLDFAREEARQDACDVHYEMQMSPIIDHIENRFADEDNPAVNYSYEILDECVSMFNCEADNGYVQVDEEEIIDKMLAEIKEQLMDVRGLK